MVTDDDLMTIMIRFACIIDVKMIINHVLINTLMDVLHKPYTNC